MGFTGLLFSHEKILPTKWDSITWSRPVTIGEIPGTDSLITAVSDELGIFGHRPFWLQWTDSTGSFHFQILNPAARYDIALTPARDTAVVKETRVDLINVMARLHVATTGGPRSWITTIWHVYALSAAVTAMSVLLISVFFWFTRSVKRRGEWLLITAVALFSISYIFFIWLVG